MTDFKNGQELLEVCKKKQCSISEAGQMSAERL